MRISHLNSLQNFLLDPHTVWTSVQVVHRDFLILYLQSHQCPPPLSLHPLLYPLMTTDTQEPHFHYPKHFSSSASPLCEYSAFSWHFNHTKHHSYSIPLSDLLIFLCLVFQKQCLPIYFFIYIFPFTSDLSSLFLIDRNCFTGFFCFYKFAEVHSSWYPSHFL